MNTAIKASLVAMAGALGIALGANGNVDGDYVRSNDYRQERIAHSVQFIGDKVVSNYWR